MRGAAKLVVPTTLVLKAAASSHPSAYTSVVAAAGSNVFQTMSESIAHIVLVEYICRALMGAKPPKQQCWQPWAEVILTAAVGAISLWGMRKAVCTAPADPYAGKRKKNRETASSLKQRFGSELTNFDEYEELLLDRVVRPDRISVEPVFGLDDILAELEDEVICLMNPHLRAIFCDNPLWRPGKGVLLYGPPGTGKTMLAKALARRARCAFLNITPSAINSKVFGDANRLVYATFTLARKLQPCIVFIDEADCLLARRGALMEHEGSLQVKHEFLALWDGMESDGNAGVLVLAATNRIDRLDEAAVRRFTTCRKIPLPDREQRKAILVGYISKHANVLPAGVLSPDLRREVRRARFWHRRPGDTRDGDHSGSRRGIHSPAAAAGANMVANGIATDNSTAAIDGSPRRAKARTRAAAAVSTDHMDGTQYPLGGTSRKVAAGGVGSGSGSGSGGSWAFSGDGNDGGGGGFVNGLVDLLSCSHVLDDLADQTEGFSGCDLFKLCSRAAQSVLHDPAVRTRLRRIAAVAEVACGEKSTAAASGRCGEELTSPSPLLPAGLPLRPGTEVLALLRPLEPKDLMDALAVMKQEMQDHQHVRH